MLTSTRRLRVSTRAPNSIARRMKRRGNKSTMMDVTHAAAQMMENQSDQAKTCGYATFDRKRSSKTRRGVMSIPQPRSAMRKVRMGRASFMNASHTALPRRALTAVPLARSFSSSSSSDQSNSSEEFVAVSLALSSACDARSCTGPVAFSVGSERVAKSCCFSAGSESAGRGISSSGGERPEGAMVGERVQRECTHGVRANEELCWRGDVIFVWSIGPGERRGYHARTWNPGSHPDHRTPEFYGIACSLVLSLIHLFKSTTQDRDLQLFTSYISTTDFGVL
jgi:hypothetical protein